MLDLPERFRHDGRCSPRCDSVANKENSFKSGSLSRSVATELQLVDYIAFPSDWWIGDKEFIDESREDHLQRKLGHEVREYEVGEYEIRSHAIAET
jgi:hypothetical protein